MPDAETEQATDEPAETTSPTLVPLCTAEDAQTGTVSYFRNGRKHNVALESAFIDVLHRYADAHGISMSKVVQALIADANPQGAPNRLRVELLAHEKRRLTEAVRLWVIRQRKQAAFDAAAEPEPSP